MIEQLVNPYIYIEYVIAVVLLTEVIKKALSEGSVHPKWLTLLVAFVMAIVGVVVQTSIVHTAVDFWKLITSFGVSCLFYDYIWKVIKDKFFSR